MFLGYVLVSFAPNCVSLPERLRLCITKFKITVFLCFLWVSFQLSPEEEALETLSYTGEMKYIVLAAVAVPATSMCLKTIKVIRYKFPNGILQKLCTSIL
jgi:hypothetical protein